MKKITIIFIIIICLGFINIRNIKANTLDSKFLETDWFKAYAKKVQFETGRVKYKQMNFIRRVNDNMYSYCIEPWESIDTNVLYKAYSTNQSTIANLSSETWEKINLIAYYGYNYNGQNADYWYAATQMLIWRAVDPKSDFYFTDVLNGNRNYAYESEMNQILSHVIKHDFAPSFQNTIQRLKVGESITITDYNNVLTMFQFKSHDNVKLEKNGNDLTITALKPGRITLTLEKTDKRFNQEPILYHSASSQDNFITGSFTSVVTNFTVDVTTPTIEEEDYKGRIEIYKVGEELITTTNGSLNYQEIPLENISFDIIAKTDIYLNNNTYLLYNKGDIVETITTDKDGYALSKILPLGEYELKEINTPMEYEEEDIRTFKLEGTETINVLNLKIKNILKKNTLVITKSDAENGEALADVEFNLYLNEELVYIGKTDENGELIINDLKYDNYFLKETKAKIGYILNYEVIAIGFSADNIKFTVTNIKIPEILTFRVMPRTSTTDNTDFSISLSTICLGWIINKKIYFAY